MAIDFVNSFHLKNYNYTRISPIYLESYNESLFRTPFQGEEISLPKVHQPSGEYLLDRPLIEKIASLRTFIESIEINRGKKSKHKIVENDHNETIEDEYNNDDDNKFVEITEENLEPIADLLAEEDLLEEVLSTAFENYKKSNDLESFDRLHDIAEQIAPIAAKIRKSKSEMNITRIISCFMDGNEDVDKVLEELHKKKSLNKYLIKRLDELINLAAKKYRISDKHPSMSEEFLKIIKDRIAAQRITDIRGTDLFVKTLAKCIEKETDEEWNNIIKDNMKSIEKLEEFHDWLVDGIEYCRKNNKIKDKIEKMERIMEIVVEQHPIWNPREDYIEYESQKMGKEDYKSEIDRIING
ncbi:hypothetical protein MACK_003000 [Theileria orientalis]|uniref:Uncharacterized protein n=1 Tax=Theileria orientalis TaxID=68886 RepID=A0A976MEG4_THEOR|nr:hypothetical protein MACK_003000 [Theileria orientalis]